MIFGKSNKEINPREDDLTKRLDNILHCIKNRSHPVSKECPPFIQVEPVSELVTNPFKRRGQEVPDVYEECGWLKHTILIPYNLPDHKKSKQSKSGRDEHEYHVESRCAEGSFKNMKRNVRKNLCG